MTFGRARPCLDERDCFEMDERNESSIRVDSETSPVTSALSLAPEQRETTSLPRSNVDFAETDATSRGSCDEGTPEYDLARTDEKSQVSYDEYEEEVEDDVAREQRGRPADAPRRALSLIERWLEWQKATVAASAAVGRTMRQQRNKGRKELSPSGKSKDTIVDDGVSDADVSVIGVVEMRERMIKDMQEEIRLEQYYEKQRVESEMEEATIRQKQLRDTQSVLLRHRTASAEQALKDERDENWARYMSCDGLPDPGSLSDMNTFLFLRSTKDEEASMDSVDETCRVITNLLHKIDKIVRYSTIVSTEYAAECELIGAELRKMLERRIDFACYRLLRNIERNMIREDTKTTRYVCVTSKAVCRVWAPIALPVGLRRHGADRDRASIITQRKSIQVEFEEIRLTVKMPHDIDCHRMALRGLWLAYDHCSIEADSYRMPRLPEHLIDSWYPSHDLFEFTKREHEEQLRIREEQAEERRSRLEEKKAILERMENPPVSPRTDKKKKRGKKRKGQHSAQRRQAEFEAMMESILPPRTDLLPYLPTPTEIVYRREDEARSEARKLLFTRCEKTEVNLRKYRILGGTYRVDLLRQPPQPKDLGMEKSLTTLQLPKEPRFVPFFRPYEAPRPAPDTERTPEVVEAETKALESAMEALVLITLKLPDSVLWFEPPLVAHWIPERNVWSTEHVHDVKFNEEKQTIAFRSGRLGVHGLAAYKFANLPFQSWELKPEAGKGGVVLTVTAAIVQAEFVVRDDRVCLDSLTGAAVAPLERILGEYTDLESLIERLQQVGCDLFPDRDAASYLKGLPVKHPTAEKHLRECMALLSTSYAFSWSRWNVTRDFREIVLQFKETHGCVAKQRTNATLLVTPLRTMRVRCTEVSPEFSSLPLEDEDAEVKRSFRLATRPSFHSLPRFFFRFAVLRRPVPTGVEHSRNQESTADGASVVQIGIDGYSASRAHQRYRRVYLKRRYDGAASTTNTFPKRNSLYSDIQCMRVERQAIFGKQ